MAKAGILRCRVDQRLAAAVESVAAKQMTTPSDVVRQLVLDGLRRVHGIDPTAMAEREAA